MLKSIVITENLKTTLADAVVCHADLPSSPRNSLSQSPRTASCSQHTPKSLPWNCLWLKRADSPKAMPLPGQLRTGQSGGVRARPLPSFMSSLKGQSDSEIIPHPSSLPRQPCGITEASVFTASQLSFFLCPFLLPPLP